MGIRKHQQGPPIDHGYAWAIVGGTFLMFMVGMGGMFRSIGILLVEFLRDFNSSTATASWVASIIGLFLAITTPLANALARRYGARRVVMTGGVIAASGIIITSQATSIEHVIICYGGLGGFGLGLTLGPSLVTVAQYFDKRRALANGIALSGGSVGAFVMPPLLRFLLDKYSTRGAMMIIGALVLHICVSGSLYRPISSYGPMPKQSKSEEEEEKQSMMENKELNNSSVSDVKATNGPKTADTFTDAPLAKVLLQRKLQGNIANNTSVISNGKHTPLTLQQQESTLDENKYYASATDIANVGLYTADMPRRHTADTTLLKRPTTSKTDHGIKRINKHETFLYASDFSLAAISTEDVRAGHEIPVQHHKDEDNKVKPSDENIKLCSLEGLKNKLNSTFPVEMGLLRNSIFLTFALANLFGNFAFVNIIVFIPAYANDLGIPKGQVAIVVSILGGVDLISRISLGWFADLQIIKRVHILAIGCFVTGVCCICAQFINGFVAMAIYCAAIGAASAPWIFLRNVVQIDLFGVEIISNVIGLSMGSNAIPLLCGPPFVGWLRDTTKQYFWPFRVCGISMMVSCFLLIAILPLAQKHQARKEKRIAEKEEEIRLTDQQV